LNYLQKIEMGEQNLIASLYFDLIRQDSKTREYRFPEQEQYESFISDIQPIYVKNHQKKIAEMKYCEVRRTLLPKNSVCNGILQTLNGNSL